MLPTSLKIFLLAAWLSGHFCCGVPTLWLTQFCSLLLTSYQALYFLSWTDPNQLCKLLILKIHQHWIYQGKSYESLLYAWWFDNSDIHVYSHEVMSHKQYLFFSTLILQGYNIFFRADLLWVIFYILFLSSWHRGLHHWGTSYIKWIADYVDTL